MAVALIWINFIINVIALDTSKWVTNIAAIVTVAIMLIIGVAGVMHLMTSGSATEWTSDSMLPSGTSYILVGVVVGAAVAGSSLGRKARKATTASAATSVPTSTATRPLDTVPALGFAGAATLEAQGRFAGIVVMKSPVMAGPGGAPQAAVNPKTGFAYANNSAGIPTFAPGTDRFGGTRQAQLGVKFVW